MLAWIAALTRRGPVLRTLGTAGFIGTAACHDTQRAVGPTSDLDIPVIESEPVPPVPDVGKFVEVEQGTAALCLQPPEDGRWQNIDPTTHSLTRIELRFVCQDQVLNGQLYPPGPAWYVHVFARCTPTDCDWGEVGAKRRDDGYIYAVYNQGFAKRHVFAKRSQSQVQPYLLVQTWTDFVDPNRPDYWAVDWFASN